VTAITGNNFQNGKWRGDATYYFSKYNHCWGWATWRRSWKNYDGDIKFWPKWSNSKAWLILYLIKLNEDIGKIFLIECI
jgi:hypothetical protein